jgi:hypothetical protein
LQKYHGVTKNRRFVIGIGYLIDAIFHKQQDNMDKGTEKFQDLMEIFF